MSDELEFEEQSRDKDVSVVLLEYTIKANGKA